MSEALEELITFWEEELEEYSGNLPWANDNLAHAEGHRAVHP